MAKIRILAKIHTLVFRSLKKLRAIKILKEENILISS